MVKANLLETTKRLIKGEKIVNVAADREDKDLAQQIVANEINEEREKKGALITEDDKYKLSKKISNYYGKKDLAQQILKLQPMYYNENKIWWLWNKKEYKWEITDETNILNFVNQLSMYNTIKTKEKNEILEALKQNSRLNKPQDIKQTWVQFKDTIIDVKTGEEFKAEPKYFITNPIGWSLNKERFIETPIIDRIFKEWVGEDYVKTLYQFLAYSILPSYPIHRLFCLIGSGMNGKSCFLRLLERFLGRENITSTELDTLLSSRFEITRLHKKLVCIMGETNFAELSKTSIIKKLTGQDIIGFEYKNKNPFEDYNYAKIFIATNNLPATTDKTVGFYRRWLIIDFPNQFSEKKDILSEIPDEEYGILAVKCLGLLKDLLDTKEFHKEGTVDERRKRYEEKSNFLEGFIHEFTIENLNGYITKASFIKKFGQWCNENKHRAMSDTSIGLAMKKLGYDSSTQHFDWMNNGKGGNARTWREISWKEEQ